MEGIINAELRPKDVLLGLYEAETDYINAGGPLGGAAFDAVAAWLHPEVVMIQAASLPYPGRWQGAAGVEAFFRAMAAVWSELEVTDVAIIEGDGKVVVHMQMMAVSRLTGRTYEAPMLQLVQIEGGLVRSIQPFYWDTALVQNVCSVQAGN